MIDLIYYNPKLRVYRNGTVERWFNECKWKVINNSNNSRGYNVISINIDGIKKTVARHRLVAYCFKGFIIENSKILIDHINGNQLDNRNENLRPVNNAENQWNTDKRKGYTLNGNKFEAQIYSNKKKIYLGLFNTAKEAHHAYITAKQKYHNLTI